MIYSLYNMEVQEMEQRHTLPHQDPRPFMLRGSWLPAKQSVSHELATARMEGVPDLSGKVHEFPVRTGHWSVKVAANGRHLVVARGAYDHGFPTGDWLWLYANCPAGMSMWTGDVVARCQFRRGAPDRQLLVYHSRRAGGAVALDASMRYGEQSGFWFGYSDEGHEVWCGEYHHLSDVQTQANVALRSEVAAGQILWVQDLGISLPMYGAYASLVRMLLKPVIPVYPTPDE